MISFQTFRLAICATISTTAFTSLVLAALLNTAFVRSSFGWLLVIIEALSVIRAIFSVVRRPLLASQQSVASEAVGLFMLCPFQLIIMLVILSSPPKPAVMEAPYHALQGISVTSSATHMLYTTILIVIASLTSGAYDADVWMRDIESSPSPFPADVIFAYALPCIARRFHATRGVVPADSSSTVGHPPAPECTCYQGQLTCSKHRPPEVASPSAEMDKRRPPVLPHTLVRIPNYAERRSVIVLELPLDEELYD